MADEPKETPESAESAPTEAPKDSAPENAPDAATLQAKLAETEAALATQTKLAEKALKDADEVKRYTIGLVTQLQARQMAADAGGAEDDEEKAAEKFRARFEKDPKAAVAETLEEALVERMGPVFREHYDNLSVREKEAGLQQAKALESLGVPVEEYVQKADALWASFAPNMRAKPGAYFDALKLVMLPDFGTLIEKATSRKVEMEKRAQMEGASAARGPRRRTGLSAEEKRIAAELEISEEAYQKHRDEMFPEEMT